LGLLSFSPEKRFVKQLLIIIVLILQLTFVIGQERKGPYVLSDVALDEFTKQVGQVQDKDNIKGWIDRHKGRRIKDNEVFQSDSRFVAYKIGLLSYWFGPYSDHQAQEQALKRLITLKNHSDLSQYKKYIIIYPVFIRKGKAISLADFGELLSGVSTLVATKEELEQMKKGAEDIARKLEEMEQFQGGEFKDLKELIPIGEVADQVSQLGLGEAASKKMQNLKGKYNDEPREGKPGKAKKGNGLEGLFPVDYAFSKWFATFVDILTDVIDCALFHCSIKDKVEKALTLAYMIMPDVMNRIASTLAKFQDSLTSDSLDTKLDKVADIARYAKMLYDDLKKLENLLAEQDFQDLFQDFDLTTTLDKMDKYGLPTEGAKDLCNHIPCDKISIKNITNAAQYEAQITGWLKEKALDEMITRSDELLKKSGIPVLERLDMAALRDFAKDEDWEKLGKRQAKSALCSYLPQDFKGDCGSIVDGNYEEAAKSIYATVVGKQTGLNPAQIKQILDAVEEEDYEKALKQATYMSTEKYEKYLGAYKGYIDSMIKNPQAYKEQIKGAVKTFMETAVDIPAAGKIINAADYLASQEGKFSWKKGVEDALVELGVQRSAAKQITSGDFNVDMQEALETAAVKIGFTSPQAIAAFKRGNWDQAMDAQIVYLNSLPLDEKGQVEYLKQRFKNKKEMLKITGSIMKELANKQDYQQKQIIEKKLQKD